MQGLLIFISILGSFPSLALTSPPKDEARFVVTIHEPPAGQTEKFSKAEHMKNLTGEYGVKDCLARSEVLDWRDPAVRGTKVVAFVDISIRASCLSSAFYLKQIFEGWQWQDRSSIYTIEMSPLPGAVTGSN